MDKEGVIIDKLINSAQTLEKSNNREEAMKKYKEALYMFNEGNMDNRLFRIQMKLGEFQQILGDLHSSINYYKASLNTAVLLKNEIFEIDALNKLAELYYLIGEIDTGIIYAEKVDQLLKNMNYVEGELEVSLYWIKVFYSKNEYYKAREIGNKAIKLCGEKHLLYKGRILNALANGFSKLASNEEHLDFLKLSLECFEKANSLRGTLIALNNIGTVYTNKLQNYKEGLEYYFRMKELCEQNDYLETNIYANINMGATFIKCLKYDEACKYLTEGLKILETTDIYSPKFFLYIYLIEVNLKLCDYEKAFHFYEKARTEFEIHPDQGSAIIYYYKAITELMLEVQQLDKAKEFAKEAVELAINEGTMIKWSVGYLYELIRIREAKNKTDINAAVDGIRFLLTKYVNEEEILNMVYDAASEIVDAGYSEISYTFIDEYKHLNSALDIVELKHKYLLAMRLKEENNKKVQLFQAALELAVKLNNSKYHRKIYTGMWECHYIEGDYEKAINYYNKNYEIGKSIALSIPEEFRAMYLY